MRRTTRSLGRQERTTRLLSRCLAIPLLVTGLMAASTPRAAAEPPVNLTFVKFEVPGPHPPGVLAAWEGTVDGDFTGDLRTELRNAWPAGPNILHVEFDFIVSAGMNSFCTSLTGILNTKTGRVVMNGWVTDGSHLGARVHEAGQQVPNPMTSQFEGIIRIMAR